MDTTKHHFPSILPFYGQVHHCIEFTHMKLHGSKLCKWTLSTYCPALTEWNKKDPCRYSTNLILCFQRSQKRTLQLDTWNYRNNLCMHDVNALPCNFIIAWHGSFGANEETPSPRPPTIVFSRLRSLFEALLLLHAAASDARSLIMLQTSPSLKIPN